MRGTEDAVLKNPEHKEQSLLLDRPHKGGIHTKKKRELQLVALNHFAWRLLDKAFSLLLQHQVHKNRRKEAIVSALMFWRHRLLVKCVHRLHSYVEETERRIKSLKMYKRLSLQKGLKRLQMYIKNADLSVQTVMLWKRIMTSRAIHCLAQYTSVHQWEDQTQERIQDFRRCSALRRGWKSLESFSRNRRWVAELGRRAKEFQTIITPVHSLLRVFLALRQRCQSTLRDTGKRSLANQHHFRSTFRKVRIAVRSAYMESAGVRQRKLAQWVFEQLHNACKRHLFKEAGEIYSKKKLLQRVCSQWRYTLDRKKMSADVAQVISRTKNDNVLHKLFRLWVNQWISRKGKEAVLQYVLGHLKSGLTARCIKAWRSFIMRKRASSTNYQVHLVSRAFKSIGAAVKRRKELTLITVYLTNTRTCKVVGKAVKAWNSYCDRKRIKRSNARTSLKHYCRHLQSQVFTALHQAVQNDINRILTLTPMRRALTQHFGLRLWKQAHKLQTNLKLSSRSWKAIQKRKMYRKYFSFWTNRMLEKQVRTKRTSKRVLEAGKRLQHYKLAPCFQAWVEFHHIHLIKDMRARKSREFFQITTLKKVIPHWFGVTRLLKLKRDRVIAAMEHHNRTLAMFLFTLLTELHVNIGIKRRVHHIAQFFSHKTKARLLWNVLYSHWIQKRVKREQEKRALNMRQEELLYTSLRHIVRIGMFWREQRMALTALSRERMKSKVWTAVAKFAERWKRKTLLKTSQDVPRIHMERKPEMFVPAKARVTPRPVPDWISTTPISTKPRPAPRRLNARIPAQVKIPAQQRLQEIEAELLEFKIEKETLERLEKQAVDEREIKRIRGLREKHVESQVRIKALCAEVASLKNGV